MQKLVETYVIDNAPAGDALAKRLAAKRAVLDRIVDISREIDKAGGFDEHFILSVMKRAATDATFQANYDAAVDADTADERALARAKAPINQQMGRLIARRRRQEQARRERQDPARPGHGRGDLDLHAPGTRLIPLQIGSVTVKAASSGRPFLMT
ncbi:hypothetical protein ACFSZS_10245 [Seohaeicola zhoushanensis]